MANNGKMGKVELYAISLLFTLPFAESLDQTMNIMTVLLGNLAPDGINFLKRVLIQRIAVDAFRRLIKEIHVVARVAGTLCVF